MSVDDNGNNKISREEFIAAVAPWIERSGALQWLAQLDSEGYLIIEGVLSSAEITRQRDALAPWINNGALGRNVFEGTRTNRVYAMLAKDPIFADLAGHALPLAFADYYLGASCLLSGCLAINLKPGESAQPWHSDDGHIDVPRPHGVFGISTFWAFDDTTASNGATEVLPGSHHWDDALFAGFLHDDDFTDRRGPDISDDPGFRADARQAIMPAGALMIARSDLWHRGGANRTDAARLIVTPQYCVGWARPLESMLLAVPQTTAKALPERVQALLGYSIHSPFMGYSDGMHPRRVLAADIQRKND